MRGLWDLVVVRFTGPGITEFQIDYGTPITDNVLGYLSETDVDDLLGQIEALKKPADQRRNPCRNTP